MSFITQSDQLSFTMASGGVGTQNPAVSFDVSGYLKTRNYIMDVTGVGTPISVAAGVAPLTFNLLGSTLSTVTITGSTLVSGINYGPGRSFTARIFASGSARPLTWAPWRWVGQTGQVGPTGLQPNRVGFLSIQCFDTTDTGVVAAFAVEGG